MKKLLSVLLCLMLLCTGVCASAERMYPLEESQTLTSVSGLFTCELPADYLILTDDLVTDLLNAVSEALQDEENDYGIDAATAEQMASILSNVDVSTSDYVYDQDFTANMNVQTMADSGMTQEDLETYCDSLADSLTNQYLGFGASEEDCQPIGMVTIGNNSIRWYQYNVNLLGAPMQQYMGCNENGDFIVLTFSNFPEGVVNAVLESFAWIQ